MSIGSFLLVPLFLFPPVSEPAQDDGLQALTETQMVELVGGNGTTCCQYCGGTCSHTPCTSGICISIQTPTGRDCRNPGAVCGCAIVWGPANNDTCVFTAACGNTCSLSNGWCVQKQTRTCTRTFVLTHGWQCGCLANGAVTTSGTRKWCI